MKKTICILLALLLALSAGLSAGASDMTVTERFLTDWINLAYAKYDRLTQENFTLDAIIAYNESRSWDDLVRARAACTYTVKLVAHYAEQTLAQSMSADDYRALMAQGLDVGDVRVEYDLYNSVEREELRTVVLQRWKGHYLPCLIELGFYDGVATRLADGAQIVRRANLLELRYLYLVNNIILLEMPPEDAKRLTDTVDAYMPELTTLYAQPFASANDALNELSRTVEELEEVELAGIEHTADMYVYMENLTFEDAITLEGQPPLLPSPVFWDAEAGEALYYWKAEGGETTTVSRRMNMDVIPNCVTYQMPGVTVEAYRMYIIELIGYGRKPDSLNDTAASFRFEGGQSMDVWWEETGGMFIRVSGQICLAPYLYLERIGAL